MTLTTILSLGLLALVACIGYKALQFFKFPASRLVGPIVAVAAIQYFGVSFDVPNLLKLGCSIVFGVYLGLRFTRDAMKDLRKIVLAAVVLTTLYLLLTLFNGWFLEHLTAIDPYTAFLAVIPGGVAEAGVLAVSYGADLSKVTVFQLARFLSIVILVPLLVQWGLVPVLKHTQWQPKKTLPLEDEEILTEKDLTPLEKQQGWGWLFLIGTLGSYLFSLIAFPAAWLLGATFSVAAVTLHPVVSFKRPDLRYYDWAQIFMGAIIGTSFTHESLMAMTHLILPLAVITIWMILSSLLLAWGLMRLFKLDFLTSFFGVLPGGLSTMIVLAEAYGCPLVIISSLQLMRLITAVMIIPILYQIIL